jgi:hypothetical protein
MNFGFTELKSTLQLAHHAMTCSLSEITFCHESDNDVHSTMVGPWSIDPIPHHHPYPIPPSVWIYLHSSLANFVFPIDD